MTEKIAKWFIGIFGFLTGTMFGKYLTVFIISLFPILELRGGLIAATILDLNPWVSFAVCFLGNILPIPFILWGIKWLFKIMKKNKTLGKFVNWCENKADKHKGQIEKYGFWGIVLFVGIPLPGTGAWTGCLIAALLNMDKKKATIAALLGVIMAGIIMMIVSFGILGNIIH